MNRRSALKSSLAAAVTNATILAASSHAAEENATKTEKTEYSLPTFSENIQILKQEMSMAVKWWKVKFGHCIYHICREEQPFFSVSRFNFHAWYQRPGDHDDKRLFHIWNCSTHGIGDIRLDVDEKLGMLTVVALEPEMKNKVIASFFLGAASP